MNKGQTEIMGMLIVVVLLMIAALLFVRFAVVGEKENPVDNSVKMIQAIHIREVVSRYSVCGNISVIDAFDVCLNDGRISAGGCVNYGCDELKKEIASIVEASSEYFERVEGGGGKTFGFLAYNIGSEEPFIDVGGCRAEADNNGVIRLVSSGKKAYFGSNGKFEVQVNLC